MVKVMLGGPLKSAAGGETEFEVEAANIRQLLERLGEKYPKLKPTLDKGVTVAIDGEIYRSANYQKVPEDAEVYLLPRMAGG